MNDLNLTIKKDEIANWLKNNAQFFPYELTDSLFLNTNFLSITATNLSDDTQIPFRFGSIENLNISFTHFTKLNYLPTDIKKLEITHSQFVELPELPLSLVELNCCNNNLNHLPTLRSNLQFLNCRDNDLVELSLENATSLVGLDYSNNPKLRIKAFPNSLNYLICENANLKILPHLPNTLEMLVVNNNPKLIFDSNNLPKNLKNINAIGCTLNKENVKALLTLSQNTMIVLYQDDFLLSSEEVKLKNHQVLEKKWAKIEKKELENIIPTNHSSLEKIKL